MIALAWIFVLAGSYLPAAQTAGALRASFKNQILQLINADRARHNLSRLAIDTQASEIADRYCTTQLQYGTTGHFTVDGQPPYMRYSFAGGNDGTSQNAAAWSAPYPLTGTIISDLIKRSHQQMMDEQTPRDGHRRTILDPAATHVGIGMAWYGGELRLTQEFVRRYLQWTRPLPRVVSITDSIVGRGRPYSGSSVEAISVHHEPFPQPLAPQSANGIETYSLPAHRRDYLPRLVVSEKTSSGATLARYATYADGRSGDFLVAADGSFSFHVPFPDGPGVYTVVVWVRRHGADRAIAASNISMRVDRNMNDPFWKYRR